MSWCSLNTATSLPTWKFGRKDRKRVEVGEGGCWTPMLEELNYRSLFSLSFVCLLWPTSTRWCSHDPTRYTDIFFCPASMKFLQIKPLCQATANYLTDWPPSGSSYSVEWPCFSLPPPPRLLLSPSPPLSPQSQYREGPLWEKSQRASFFSEDYIFQPPFHLPPSSFSKLSKIRRVWCVWTQGEVGRGV